MQITKELIERLLWEEESATLDFKSAQYPFANASDDAKSELLKDVLAFANAHRREDAFVLIGVKSAQGGRSKIIGVNEQLDDAHVQQFINSKTQRPVTFSYKAIDMDGLPIAVLHFPKQRRPFYATGDLGKVKKHAVYVRRGSSTAIAMPDEIAVMGADQLAGHAMEPELSFSAADRSTGCSLSTTVFLECLALDVPPTESIPRYRKPENVFIADIFRGNENYYRELAAFSQTMCLVRRMSFSVANAGDVTAQDVRVVMDVPDLAGLYTFMAEDDLPDEPKMEANFIVPLHSLINRSSRPYVCVTKLSNIWRIECQFGKVQPKDTVLLPDDLYVGSIQSGDLSIEARIYADNLSVPRNGGVNISFNVKKRSVTMDEINAGGFDRSLKRTTMKR